MVHKKKVQSEIKNWRYYQGVKHIRDIKRYREIKGHRWIKEDIGGIKRTSRNRLGYRGD